MNTLIVAWEDSTGPVLLGSGPSFTLGEVLQHIRATAGAGAVITRVSDREWYTVDPESSENNRRFVLSQPPTER